MRRKIYIAGPISHGPLAVNVGVACSAAKQLLHLGYAVYVPHLFTILDCTKISHGQNDEFRVTGKKEISIPYGNLLSQDLEWIACCDAVYVCLDGESKGTKAETEFARINKIPVFNNINLLHAHFVSLEKNVTFERITTEQQRAEKITSQSTRQENWKTKGEL